MAIFSNTTLGKPLTQEELKNILGGLQQEPTCSVNWICADGSNSGTTNGPEAARNCGGGVMHCAD